MPDQQTPSPPSNNEPTSAPESAQGAPDDSALDAGLAANVARLEKEQAARQEGDKAREDDSAERTPVKPRVPKPGRNEYQVLHDQRVKNATERQELAKVRQEIETQRKAIESAKRSPMEALKAMGYADPKEFLEQIAKTGGEITPEQQKIWELEERLSAREKAENEMRAQQEQAQQSAQYNAQVGEWHKAIRNHVGQSNAWKDSLVALQGQESQVLSVLQEQHDRYGESLDIREGLEYALDTVNRSLEAQMRQGIQQIAANPRGRALLNEIVAPVSNSSRSPSRARNNGLTSEVSNQTDSDRRSAKDLSLDDMLERNSAILRRENGRF